MSTSTIGPVPCARCGRACGSTVTYYGGLATCGYCAHDMTVHGNVAWMKSGTPSDGPGSHAWDLREMREQSARADKAESELSALRAALSSPAEPQGEPDCLDAGCDAVGCEGHTLCGSEADDEAHYREHAAESALAECREVLREVVDEFDGLGKPMADGDPAFNHPSRLRRHAIIERARALSADPTGTPAE